MYDWDDDDDDDISGGSYYDDDSECDVPIVEMNRQEPRIQKHAPVLEPGSNFVHDLKLHAEQGDVEAVTHFIDSLPAHAVVSAAGDSVEENGKLEQVDVDVGGGNSALIIAAAAGRVQTVEVLLSRGADPNLRANDGTTPLLAACSSTKADEEQAAQVVRILVRAGGRLVEEETTNTFSSSSVTHPLLHTAARLNQPQVITSLVESGLDVNTRDQYDWTPLMVAADSGALAAANALIALGADPLLRIRPRRSFDPNTIDATAATLASLSNHTQLSDALRVLSGHTSGDDRLYRVLKRLREEQEAEDKMNEEEEGREDEEDGRKADELMTFLHGVGLYELLPKLRSQGVTLNLLMKTSDTQLKEMGVEKLGDRTRILNTVHEMHKVAWTEDKPAHLEFGKPLKLRDLVAVAGNTGRHMEFLDASLSYINNQMREYKQFYITAVETRPNAPAMIASIDGICDEGIESCRQLFNNLCHLRRQAAIVRGEAEVSTVPDLILPVDQNLERKQSGKRKFMLPAIGAVLLFLAFRGRHHVIPLMTKAIAKVKPDWISKNSR